jgi:hypothetical protein
MQIATTRQVTIPLQGNAVTFDVPQGMSLRAIRTPAALDGDNLTFEAGDANSTAPLYDGGSVYSVACGINRHIAIKREVFVGPSYLKLSTNASTNPQNQSAARTFTLYFAAE